jgi:hypothetical protein
VGLQEDHLGSLDCSHEEYPRLSIVEVIDTDHPEGIYLGKYLPLCKVGVPAQSGRILWYGDIIRALHHIHDLGIAPSDVRIDNVSLTIMATLCSAISARPVHLASQTQLFHTQTFPFL